MTPAPPHADKLHRKDMQIAKLKKKITTMQRSKKNAITRVKKVQTKADQRVQSAKRRVTRWKKKV